MSGKNQRTKTDPDFHCRLVSSPRISSAICDSRPDREPPNDPLIGILPGDGIGPDLAESAVQVLEAARAACDLSSSPFSPRLEFGGPIGDEAVRKCGKALPDESVEFCSSVFRRGGAILAGPGGDRFVYDLRREFELFCKVNPVRPSPELEDVARLRSDHLDGTDVVVLRESMSGLYAGEAAVETRDDGLGRILTHRFSYDDVVVHRFLKAAAAVARQREGKLTVVMKSSGMPALSEQWRRIAEEITAGDSLILECVDIDLASYRLIHEPQAFDVIAAPNCFGDILADLGGVITGNRSLTYGASFSPGGCAVYQTNHGAAYDIADTDRANPAGHLLALGFLLHESFGLTDAAVRIETAIRHVFASGIRTADVACPGHGIVGTREFTARVAKAITSAEASPVAACS